MTAKSRMRLSSNPLSSPMVCTWMFAASHATMDLPWCEAAIYREDEDIVTSEPSDSFYNHWVCQTANATYYLYMGIADE